MTNTNIYCRKQAIQTEDYKPISKLQQLLRQVLGQFSAEWVQWCLHSLYTHCYHSFSVFLLPTLVEKVERKKENTRKVERKKYLSNLKNKLCMGALSFLGWASSPIHPVWKLRPQTTVAFGLKLKPPGSQALMVNVSESGSQNL